jgi:hypothetical protein
MAQKKCDLHAGELRQKYRHALRIRNTHCFPTATMVARTRLSVTLNVHCLYSSMYLVGYNLNILTMHGPMNIKIMYIACFVRVIFILVLNSFLYQV